MMKYQRFSLNQFLVCLFDWLGFCLFGFFPVTAADHAVSVSYSEVWTDLIFFGCRFPHEYIGQEEKIRSHLLLQYWHFNKTDLKMSLESLNLK